MSLLKSVLLVSALSPAACAVEVVSRDSTIEVPPENQVQVQHRQSAVSDESPTANQLPEATTLTSQGASAADFRAESPATVLEPVQAGVDTANSGVIAQENKGSASKPAVARTSSSNSAKVTTASANAPRTRDVEVTISGLDEKLEKNARVYLTLARKDSVVRSRYQLRRLVSNGRNEIAEALEAYGYYNAEITSDIEPDAPISSSASQAPWRVKFVVEAGPRVVYEGFTVQVAGPGAKIDAVRKAVDALVVKSGDPLLHPQYEAEKRRILSATRDTGYIDAKYVLSELRVNPTTNKVNALLRMTTGALYQFGSVTLVQDVLNDDLVQEFVPFKAGDRYDSDKLIELQLALNDTRYFNRVEVDVDREAAVSVDSAGSYEDLDGSQQPAVKRLPVNVLLSPGKHRSYKSGFGYGTDTGGRVSLGYENRRLNKAGHQLKAETRFSELSSEAAVRYSLPVVNKGTDRLSFNSSYKHEQPADEGALTQQRSELRLERVKPRLRRSAYVAFEREEFELGNQVESSKLLIPGAGISWINTTNRLRPKFGLSLSGDIHGAAEGVLADTTFLQLTTEVDTVWTFQPRWRLIGRAHLVYSELGGSFNSLPASQRQFAGGTGSVRGFGYQKLAPRDSSGEVIGGRHLSTFSGELEYQFANSWSVAAFVDSGNAGSTFMADLQTGAGMGLRWILPFGQIRFDVAKPITGDESQPRFHLSLGPDL